MRWRWLSFLVLFPSISQAGVHYSGEQYRALPAKWSGFLPDHRSLRGIAAPTGLGGRSNPLRDQYADAALKLEAASRSKPLTADESADLGALYIRLGQSAKAVDLLRLAAREHPDHFRLAANLGTAWQMVGDLAQAAAALEDAVRLVPREWKDVEALHLKLVRLRMKEAKGKDQEAPDDLFPAPIPETAVAQVQQLALWLPADGRLLWQLAELAEASGDVRTAAALLDGCVTEFTMASPKLRSNRLKYRAAADALDATETATKTTLQFKSSRALLRGIDPGRLPPIKPDGVNALPWVAIGETNIGPKGKPEFLDYVSKLDGRTVTLTGFMTPAGANAAELTGFLLTEFPVGCWFCETPGPTQVITVELAPGVTTEPTRQVLKLTGKLQLNRNDPERFPFTITEARLGVAD